MSAPLRIADSRNRFPTVENLGNAVFGRRTVVQLTHEALVAVTEGRSVSIRLEGLRWFERFEVSPDTSIESGLGIFSIPDYEIFGIVINPNDLSEHAETVVRIGDRECLFVPPGLSDGSEWRAIVERAKIETDSVLSKLRRNADCPDRQNESVLP